MSQEPKDSKESTKSSKSKSKENKEPEASVDEQAGAAPDDQFIGWDLRSGLWLLPLPISIFSSGNGSASPGCLEAQVVEDR